MVYSYAFIHWNIDPAIFTFSGFSLRYYSLMFVLAFFFGYRILASMYAKEQVDERLLNKLVIYMVIGTLAGARLGDCLFYDWSYYHHHLLEIFLPVVFGPGHHIRFTGYRGLASHGGAAGILIAVCLYCRKYQVKMLWLLDRLVIVVALAGFFIRTGNLFNSEIIGTPTQLPWAFIFERVDGIPRHPAQLYEAFGYLFVFGLLYRLFRRNRDRLDGYLLGIFLTAVFGFRFFIEFWKENQEAFESRLALDMGQLLSIPFIMAGLYLWLKKAGNRVTATKRTRR